MGMKGLLSFKAKVLKPCSTLLSKLKRKFVRPSNSLRTPTFRMPRRRTKVVRFRKPFSIRSLGFPKNKFRLKKRRPKVSSGFKKAFQYQQQNQPKLPKKPVQKVRIGELLTVLFSIRKDKDMEMDDCDQGVAGDVSVSDKGNGKEPFPSPITPAFLRVNAPCVKDSSDDYEEDEEDDVNDDGCKSFEDCLVEMIVEEGKVKDLMDVEELLFCWGNLKNPIFMELVSRFYSEICKDVFATCEGEDSHVSSVTYY